MTKTRVLVVDDSAVIRRAISSLLGEDPAIEVVGQAANGEIAIQKIKELAPDVITLDVEMPVLDGLDTLRRFKAEGIQVPVIMCSTLTERGGMATLDALSLGAACYVTKPKTSASVAESIDALRQELLPKVKALGHRRPSARTLPVRSAPRTPTEPTVTSAGLPTAPPSSLRSPGPSSRDAAPQTASRPTLHGSARAPLHPQPPQPPQATPQNAPPFQLAAAPRFPTAVKIVLIGVSTGGPNALAKLLPALPANFPVPVLVVQHMPPIFTKLVADRINTQSQLTVKEAAEGDLITPGTVLLAPGDFHMTVDAHASPPRIRLTQDPPENFCRPAVDELFRSAIPVYGPGILAVVLTGMGSDGSSACEAVKQSGGRILVQDEATSVVWGMPGSVAEKGLAEAVLPLEQIAPEILKRTAPAMRAQPPTPQKQRGYE